jgi:hypothetical protein
MGDHHPGSEQEPERVGEPPCPIRVGDGVAEPQAKQRALFLHRRFAAVGLDQEAKRPQLVDEVLDIILADGPAGRRGSRLRHLCRGATTVDLTQGRVQQWGELDGLAVGATNQGRRDPVAGSRHLADQFNTGRAMQAGLRRPCLGGRHRHLSALSCVSRSSSVSAH